MRLPRVERSLLFAGAFVGIVAHGPGAFAQNVPAAPAALAPGAPATPAVPALPGLKLRGGQDRKTPNTAREPGAKITGRFGNAAVLNSASDKIRLDAAGRCDTVNAAVDGANSAAVVCDRGKSAYFMQRGTTEWTYVAPPLIAAKIRPAGQ